jgi:hypothetical protein
MLQGGGDPRDPQIGLVGEQRGEPPERDRYGRMLAEGRRVPQAQLHPSGSSWSGTACDVGARAFGVAVYKRP